MLSFGRIRYLEDNKSRQFKSFAWITPEFWIFLEDRTKSLFTSGRAISALSFFETHGKYREEIVDLDDGVTIEIGKGGNQSEFYILTAGGKINSVA